VSPETWLRLIVDDAMPAVVFCGGEPKASAKPFDQADDAVLPAPVPGMLNVSEMGEGAPMPEFSPDTATETLPDRLPGSNRSARTLGPTSAKTAPQTIP